MDAERASRVLAGHGEGGNRATRWRSGDPVVRARRTLRRRYACAAAHGVARRPCPLGARHPVSRGVIERHNPVRDRLHEACSPRRGGAMGTTNDLKGASRADRRRFMLGSVAALGAGSGLARGAFAAAPLGAVEHEVPADASKAQGYPLADESYGSRSQFETEVRTRFKTSTP